MAVQKGPKVTRIQHIALFRHADKKGLEHLAQAADEVTVPAGKVLITQGRNGTEAFVIESGSAEVLVDDKVVADIPSGEIVGELGFLDRGPATATVRAKSEMDVLVIPYNRFDQVMDDNPDMVKAMAKELAARLRAADAHLQ